AIALAAEGGMRDALSLLDQAISYSDEKVMLDDVLAVTGDVSQSVLTEMAGILCKEEVTEELRLIQHMIENGKDPTRFVFDMIYFLRDLLFYKTAPELADVLETAIVDEQFKEITDTVDAVWLEEAIMKFNDCQQQIKWTNSPKIIIEITLLSIVNREKNITHPQVQTADINDADKVEWKELSKKINNLEKKISNINMNEGKEQSKPTSNQRRQSSAN